MKRRLNWRDLWNKKSPDFSQFKQNSIESYRLKFIFVFCFCNFLFYFFMLLTSVLKSFWFFLIQKNNKSIWKNNSIHFKKRITVIYLSILVCIHKVNNKENYHLKCINVIKQAILKRCNQLYKEISIFYWKDSKRYYSTF